MKKINYKILFIFFILTLIFINIKVDIFSSIKDMQLNLTKKFIKSIKEGEYYWFIIIFFYGVVHSLGPGHGKSFLMVLSCKYKKRMLILFSGIIVYMQAVISYLIVIFLFNNISMDAMILKKIDNIGILMYTFLLVFILLYKIFEELIQKKSTGYFALIGALLPCSGVISIMMVLKILNYNQYLLFSALLMSTGMFFTLSIFSLFLEKVQKYYTKYSEKTKYFNLFFYLMLLLFFILYKFI